MFAAECDTGARIGELAGAQVGHGVFADHYSIMRWAGEHTNADGEVQRWDPPPGVSTGDIFCEHDNETSKTDVPRVMCVVGRTRLRHTMLALAFTSRRTTFVLPCRQAACNGVHPSLSVASMAAPFSMRSCTRSTKPR